MTQLQKTSDAININQVEIPEPSSNGDLITATLANDLIRNYLAMTDQKSIASTEQAKTLAKILVGSYPSRQVHDAEIYARGVASIFSEYHPTVGKEAVDKLTRNCKFMPTRAEVVTACEVIVSKAGVAARTAKKHMEEKDRREKEEARNKELAEDKISQKQKQGAIDNAKEALNA